MTEGVAYSSPLQIQGGRGGRLEKAKALILASGVSSLAVTKSGKLLASTDWGLYQSVDNGGSWTKTNFGGTCFHLLVTQNGTIFAGWDRIYRSQDDAKTWQVVVDSAVVSGLNVIFNIAETPSGVLLAGAEGNYSNQAIGILRSTDGGATWNFSNSGLGNLNVTGIASAEVNHIAVTLASTYDGLFYSSPDEGKTWSRISGIPSQYSGKTVNVSQRFGAFASVGTFKQQSLYRSLDGLGNWEPVTEFPVGYDVLLVMPYGDDSHLLIGTADGLWIAEFDTIATGVKKISGTVPMEFTLHQNYPNPFNPSTTISFSLPRSEFARLKIFDLTGREITTLISKNLAAGNYSFKWDANNQPSGVYFYQLQAGQYSETKKLLLLK